MTGIYALDISAAGDPLEDGDDLGKNFSYGNLSAVDVCGGDLPHADSFATRGFSGDLVASDAPHADLSGADRFSGEKIDPYAYFSVLTDEQKRSVLSAKTPLARRMKFASALLLNYVFRLYGKDVRSIRRGRHGKPEADGIYFNIAHTAVPISNGALRSDAASCRELSDGMVICAVSDTPVGCDIESCARPIKSGTVKMMADRFLSAEEKAFIYDDKGFAPTVRTVNTADVTSAFEVYNGTGVSAGLKGSRAVKSRFLLLWTVRESYMKMTGEGLGLALNSFETRFGEGGARVLRDGVPQACRIITYYLRKCGYFISVCAACEEREETVAPRDFESRVILTNADDFRILL